METPPPGSKESLFKCLSTTSSLTAKLQANGGYAVVNGALSPSVQEEALLDINHFIEDVSNGHDNLNLNKNQWWDHSGAGWLLSKVRANLVDSIFSDLYGTDHLHSAKEGFLQVSEANSTTILHDPSLASDCSHLRAVCVFSEHSKSRELDEHSHHHKNDDTHHIIELEDLDPHCKPDPQKHHSQSVQLSLSSGSVLLFLSDTYRVAYTTTLSFKESSSSSFVVVSTLSPACWTSNSILPRKLLAYRQRQTSSTYSPHAEEWTSLIDDHSQNFRNYFRCQPPLLTISLAQMYGLMPYFNDTTTTQEQIQTMVDQALKKGIRFEANDIVPPTDRRPCSVNLQELFVVDDPRQCMKLGKDKYLGGMESSCGKYIYGVPGAAEQVLRIDIAKSTMDFIGPKFSGKFKWLRGISIPSNPELSIEGCSIALPCNHPSFLKITKVGDVYPVGQDVLEAELSGGWYYHGGAQAANGWIYCIPANTARVVKYHPGTDEVVFIGPSFDDMAQKWFGGLLSEIDGCIYGIPHNATGVLKINPVTDEVTIVEPKEGPLDSGLWKWHGGLMQNFEGKEYLVGFPNNAEDVLVMDVASQNVSTLPLPAIIQRHRFPKDGKYKWLGKFFY